MSGITKAQMAVYKLLFEMIMQAVLTVFAMVIFSICFYKFIASDNEFDTKKWGAANVTFVGMIFLVYAYYFKKEDKKEESKFSKLSDAVINRISGNSNPPGTP